MMKTTIEIPDDLFRQAKAKAALEGMRLRDLIERGLRLVLETPPSSQQSGRRAAFPLIRASGNPSPLDAEQVAAALTEMDEADAQRHASSVRR
jgi:hypothetical protein